MDNIQIVYEDDDLAVINKPPGVVVNDALTVRGETVQAWWQSHIQPAAVAESEWQALIPTQFSDQYGTPQEIFDQRGGIVHRLDKDTSGALVLAKNPGALVHLLHQFKQRKVHKTYRALLHGRLPVPQATLDFPIKRSSRDKMKMSVHPEGRSAVTHYKMVAEYRHQDASLDEVLSLVECVLETGRMHQIRVHFAHIRHPLVSDRLYAGRKRYKQDLSWCPRHFLHACNIEFTHPRTNSHIAVEAPLADDLALTLDTLQILE
ncbi:RluA family pseudouridine synthase [Candidatus Woesebacteria bacterium]|nr:RluA family pseudouridine synthase [Candidatus Woesebacteria bacterium]